jgi:PAS domain S-box-containing protein
MKMNTNALWLFPVGLFIFLSLFTVTKFIFIFFFSTAFEPLVLFDLTPLSFIPGLGSLQLLTLTMSVLLVDTFLHAKATRRSLMLSYLPTGFLCSGAGLTILVAPASSAYILHYVLFGCLLVVMIADQKHLLTLPDVEPELPRKHSFEVEREGQLAAPARRPSRPETQTPVSMASPQVDGVMVDAFRASSELMVKNMEALNEFLNQRTQRMMEAEARLDERRDSLIKQQEALIDRLVSYNMKENRQSLPPPLQREHPAELPRVEKNDFLETTVSDLDWMVIVQRGIVKETSKSLLDSLGYSAAELLNTRFVSLLTPWGRDEARRHWHGNLTGDRATSYRTVLLTKDGREIPVTVSVKPTLYHGAYADFLLVRQTSVTIVAKTEF